MKKNILLIGILVLLLGCTARKQAVLPLVERSEQEKEEIYNRAVRYSEIKVSLTNQWRDSLVYSQDTIYINYSPLLDFDGISRAIVHEYETLVTDRRKGNGWSLLSPHSFYCGRGYIARWYIEDNKLYLGKVSPRILWIDPKKNDINLFDSRQRIKQSVINKRVEAATGRKYVNGRIFADWVTGPMKGSIGPFRHVWDPGSKSVVIQVKKGVIGQVEIVPVN